MTTTKRLLTTLVFILAACGGPQQRSATRVTQFQVTPQQARTASGLTQQLRATATYEDGHEQDVSSQVSWASSDQATATVDAVGLVTSAAVGSTRVVASLGQDSATAEVTVTDATLVSIEVLSNLTQVPIGVAVTAVARGHLSDGSDADLTSQAIWFTPLGGLVIESPGVARASMTGPARLAVSFNGMQGFVDLQVTAAAAEALEVMTTHNLAALPLGALVPVTVLAYFTDGSTIDVSADTVWTSNAGAVAAVEGGRVHGLGLGHASLIAVAHGQSALLAVTVTAAELFGVAMSPPVATIPLGGSIQLSIRGYYSDGTFADLTDEVTWSSLDPLAVQVSNQAGEKGRAFGLLSGQQAVVTAELPGTGLSATSLIMVDAEP